ncbi:hypothetical protein [Hoeflea prorocentri]|uniref:Uncharacterized protein n=1 Tax=Hoeflea prorocentri TaxID=1922333 RepID=A0A9X3ZGW1_9HYPH|nr:hypothetical protein [Hoeflea prorocentri]MCY6380221.1 hypothetical protein [Hoeflea prorocentri]MDA5398021.1 hypothetical protein [Hoeflea prorocentri]
MGFDSQNASSANRSLIRGQRRLINAGQLGPESHSGAFNPASILIDGDIHLLCRAEADGQNWVYGQLFETWSAPILCTMGKDLSLQRHQTLTYERVEGARPEDWRLLHHEGKIYTNHCVYLETSTHNFCSAALSELDVDRQRIFNQVILRPPFHRRLNEKNWVMFSHEGRLLCLYSVDPYLLLEVDPAQGDCKTVVALDAGEFSFGKQSAGPVFNSTNPVVWDADHYVTFIHQRFDSVNLDDRNRLYLQFGMLIDRKTLLPVSIVAEPLITGGMAAGRHKGVHYTMSLMVAEDVLYAFYGEGDTHTGVVEFDKAALGDAFSKHYFGHRPSFAGSQPVFE